MRYAHSKYVNLVASTPTTVYFTGTNINELVITSVSICHPIYFRADGAVAALHAEDNYVVIGLGATQRIDVDYTNDVYVSLISELGGYVNVIAVEAN